MDFNFKCQKVTKPFIILFALSLFIPLSTAADNSPFEISSSETSLTAINVQLKWRHQFQFAGYYAAIEQGFYRQAGLDVTLKEAGPKIDPIKEVVSGKADFGIANSELMLYRLKGEPVTALAAIIQHSPIVLMSLKESNIYSPQDLIGKKLMYPEGHYGANTLGVLLKEGIQKSQIESVPLSFNIQDLITKKVDAMVGYITDQPFSLQAQGIEYNLIDPRTYGIDFYGDILFSHEDYVNEHPDRVAKFREATLSGWRYALEHPDEIIELILQSYPTLKNKQELEYEAQETIKLMVPMLVDLGHMNPGRWQYIAQTFIDLDMATGEFEAEGFLYSPESNRSIRLLQLFLQASGVLALLAILFICGLFYFNKQLKRAIAEKTMYLTKANRELIVYTKQIKEKEDELFQLNKDLEKRIHKRTETINKVNHELTLEIEQRKQRELSLQLLSKAIEHSSSIVLVIDKKHIINYASKAFLKLTGFAENNIFRQPLKVLENKLTLPEISNSDFAPSGDGMIHSELKCIAHDNVTHWLNTSISLLWSESKEISHYVIIFEDITELKARKDEMEKMALYDPLTGLENRVLFQTRLDKAIHDAKRSMIKTALLFIDIDNFKEINDSFGHEAGDRVLKAIAERLKANVRQNDTIARISGDEFTVLLSDIQNYEDAGKVTRAILAAFKEPIHIKSREIFVTASIGISITPEDSLNISTLINNADMAMYKAKQQGRDNYQFFSEEMNIEIKHKNKIESEVKTSIDNDEFFLVYLPKINLHDSSIIGAEALLRWQYSKNEVRQPDSFIPIAEESGTIIPLGKWVLNQVFEDIQSLLAAGVKHLKISVNISHRQLSDKHFISEVRALFSSHPNYIQYLEFEVTEKCFIDKHPENIARLNELRSMGFTISVDDFGTGYSSLSYLKRLPIDTVKIDRALIKGLPNDQDNTQITRAIVSMAHQLNFSVVAEGVENEEQNKFLNTINCDTAQGFHYDRPMYFEQLIEHFSMPQGKYIEVR